jgi:hypothetical protein
MGFFSGHRLMPIYLDSLRQYGINTSLMPAKLHVAIMEESERDSLRTASRIPGFDKDSVVEGGVSLIGELVALLVLGPSIFDNSRKNSLSRSFMSASQMIEELAEKWISAGANSSNASKEAVAFRVLTRIDQSGFLNQEFVNSMRVEVARQQALGH